MTEQVEKLLADQRTSLLREFQAVVLLWRYQYTSGTSGMQACNGILEQIGGNPDWQGEPQLKHAQDALFEIYEMVHEKPLAGMAVPTRIVEMVRGSLKELREALELSARRYHDLHTSSWTFGECQGKECVEARQALERKE